MSLLCGRSVFRTADLVVDPSFPGVLSLQVTCSTSSVALAHVSEVLLLSRVYGPTLPFSLLWFAVQGCGGGSILRCRSRFGSRLLWRCTVPSCFFSSTAALGVGRLVSPMLSLDGSVDFGLLARFSDRYISRHGMSRSDLASMIRDSLSLCRQSSPGAVPLPCSPSKPVAFVAPEFSAAASCSPAGGSPVTD